MCVAESQTAHDFPTVAREFFHCIHSCTHTETHESVDTCLILRAILLILPCNCSNWRKHIRPNLRSHDAEIFYIFFFPIIYDSDVQHTWNILQRSFSINSRSSSNFFSRTAVAFVMNCKPMVPANTQLVCTS